MDYSEVECPYARAVADRVADRAKEGMKKYGVTMERTDINTLGWIDHAIEEALDFSVYLTRLKQDIARLHYKPGAVSAWEDYPND